MDFIYKHMNSTQLKAFSIFLKYLLATSFHLAPPSEDQLPVTISRALPTHITIVVILGSISCAPAVSPPQAHCQTQSAQQPMNESSTSLGKPTVRHAFLLLTPLLWLLTQGLLQIHQNAYLEERAHQHQITPECAAYTSPTKCSDSIKLA